MAELKTKLNNASVDKFLKGVKDEQARADFDSPGRVAADRAGGRKVWDRMQANANGDGAQGNQRHELRTPFLFQALGFCRTCT